MRIVTHESPEDGQFYVRFEGDNGEPWFVSEGYVSRTNATRSVLDFFGHLGKIMFITNGVISFNIEIVHLNAEGNVINTWKQALHDPENPARG